mmetsp:Transcript_14446/g.24648  ORF Transcript_14446/g.24648 Transcript_14446/m.24648 type:complete len:81 (+) Transcript_14446:166-408(+)
MRTLKSNAEETHQPSDEEDGEQRHHSHGYQLDGSKQRQNASMKGHGGVKVEGKDMMEERQIVDLLNVRHNQLDMFLWQMY